MPSYPSVFLPQLYATLRFSTTIQYSAPAEILVIILLFYTVNIGHNNAKQSLGRSSVYISILVKFLTTVLISLDNYPCYPILFVPHIIISPALVKAMV